MLQGRTFNERDTASSSPVAIVSESLARKYWPGESAVGKRIKPRIAGSSWCIVVGVVADVRHWGADMAIEPTAYYAYTQVPDSIRSLVEANMGIAVHSRLQQGGLLYSIKAAVAGLNSEVAVYDVKTMESMVADSDSLRNFDLLLLGGFSFLALTLAAVGVTRSWPILSLGGPVRSASASRSVQVHAMFCALSFNRAQRLLSSGRSSVSLERFSCGGSWPVSYTG